MIVRKIKPQELKRTNELFAIAFEFPAENEKSAEEVYEEAAANSKSREDYYWKERWAAFEDDDVTMMSYFIAKPYPVNFDGNSAAMYGIGGVATLPQYRRNGGIRACFEKSLPAMYEEGAVFSYLYPFSTSYYRKFGYEMCCERLRYKIRLSAIKAFAAEGKCYLAEEGSLWLSDIKKVYEVWQNQYNMMVVNEDFEYEWVNNINPVKNQEFVYIYKSKDGEPRGFMVFRKTDEEDGRNLTCSRFFFTDREGFGGLMNLLYTYSGDHKYVTFELPSDKPVTSLLPEWSMGAGKCEIVYWGMVRVVNVLRVLKMARYKGSGTLIIKILDTLIPQNNQSFFVCFLDGAAAEVVITEEEEDVSMPVSDFSRLISGACGMEEIEFMEHVHVNKKADVLSKIFYKKPVYIAEYF